MNEVQSLLGAGLGSAFGPSVLFGQSTYQQRNYCPCCGQFILRHSGIDGLQNLSHAYLVQNSRKPQPLPSDKEMKDRFESLSKRIDAAVEKYNGLLS